MNTKAVIKALALQCIKRNEACADCSGNGAKAGLAAVNFFIGAANLAEIQGNKELFDHLQKVIVFSVSIRGIDGVRELSTWED